MSGHLISVEGLDGVGKSTLISRLVPGLQACGHDVLSLREPGGVAAAERIRTLVKDPDLPLDARAELLLFCAARAQLFAELVGPALNAGRTVLLDRFVDSTVAYQGAGRQLGEPLVRGLSAFATAGRTADVTVLLRLSEQAARARRHVRDGADDRIEQADSAFWERVSGCYERLADREHVVVVDAGQTPEQVAADALRGVLERLR